MNTETRQPVDLDTYTATLTDRERMEVDVAGVTIDISILLQRARKHRGLSQAELARRIGRRQQAVSQIERPGSNPTIETIALYLTALGYGIQFAITDPCTGEIVECVTAPRNEIGGDEISDEDMELVLAGEEQIRLGEFVTLAEMRRSGAD